MQALTCIVHSNVTVGKLKQLLISLVRGLGQVQQRPLHHQGVSMNVAWKQWERCAHIGKETKHSGDMELACTHVCAFAVQCARASTASICTSVCHLQQLAHVQTGTAIQQVAQVYNALRNHLLTKHNVHQ